jgi:predicted aspartyl protease
MPIKDCPFTLCRGGIYRPMLPIRIINPNVDGGVYRTIGLIDTGADECAIPAAYASILGHNLLSGQSKQIGTGNGITTAYSHSTTIEIYDPATKDIGYRLDETPIDFMPNLTIVLLGVKSFLNRFILTIDYPRKTFSIQSP